MDDNPQDPNEQLDDKPPTRSYNDGAPIDEDQDDNQNNNQDNNSSQQPQEQDEDERRRKRRIQPKKDTSPQRPVGKMGMQQGGMPGAKIPKIPGLSGSGGSGLSDTAMRQGAAAGGRLIVGFFATPAGWVVIALIIILLLFLFIYLKLGDNEGKNVSVRLDKSASPHVENKEPINYALTVSYTGNPTQIIVTDTVPDNATFVSAGQNAVTLDASGQPTADPALVKTVKWTIAITGSTGTGTTTGAGCTKISDPAGADWVQINSLDSLFLEKVNEVNTTLGVCVPVNLIKALVYLESGGAMLDVNPDGSYGNGAGYGGIMQVSSGSWCDHTKYDITTSGGNVGCGIEHLAHTYQQCNNSWEGAVTAYYAGHCTPDGSADRVEDGGSGKTDQVYRDEIIARWHELDAL